MLLPPMHSFFSSASFLNRILIFFLSPDLHRTITSTEDPPPQPDVFSPSQSDRPNLTFNQLDLEFAEQHPDLENGDTSGIGINHPDWKRTRKIVEIVGLGEMGIVMTPMVNAMAATAANRDLYMAYIVIIFLVLFTGRGLSLFSVAKTRSPYVGWVQRRLIFFTLFFVSTACFLRFHHALLLADVYIEAVGALVGAALICLYLCLARPATRTALLGIH